MRHVIGSIKEYGDMNQIALVTLMDGPSWMVMGLRRPSGEQLSSLPSASNQQSGTDCTNSGDTSQTPMP